MTQNVNSIVTEKSVAFGSQIKLEFRSVGFCGGRKSREPGEKPFEQGRELTTNSTHMTLGAGFKPGPHWWEASALSHHCTIPAPVNVARIYFKV